MEVNKDVKRVVGEFVLAKKPIGLCCISPVIAARLLPRCQITLGQKPGDASVWPYSGSMDACSSMGAQVVERDVNQIQVDENYKLVSTPAFMKNATYDQVYDGIGRMIEAVLKMA